MEQENNSEPQVRIFNEEVKKDDFHSHHHNHDDHDHGHHRGHLGRWIVGLLFLFFGVVLLLNHFGVVSENFWYYLWLFWPVILILIGIRIILR